MRAFTNTERRIIVLAQEKGIYNRSAKSKLPAFILPCEVADPPGYSEAAEYLYKRGLIRYGTGRLIATRRGLEVLERWKGARYAGAFDLPARGLKRERAAEKGRFLR
jgi:hypothetical protein